MHDGALKQIESILHEGGFGSMRDMAWEIRRLRTRLSSAEAVVEAARELEAELTKERGEPNALSRPYAQVVARNRLRTALARLDNGGDDE